MTARPRVRIDIETSLADRTREANALAEKLRLLARDARAPTSAANETDLVLAMRDDGWELRTASPTMKPGAGLSIDFAWVAAGRQANLSRRQPLARAIGRDARSVLDATAGLGHDAALLAAIGYDVTAMERSDVLAAMLESALASALRDPAIAKALGDRLRIVHADAREALSRSGAASFDCVYLDPMFPPKRKASALASKEIRLVRALVGEDDDASALLAAARAHMSRVVVKRPTHAPPLADGVNASISGKLVRYDLYVQGKGES